MQESMPQPLSRVPLATGNESAEWVAMHADLILDPPYQRGSVWGVRRQRNLWRSLLSGIHVGMIVLSEREDGSDAVVDGRQRIEAVRAFLSGDLDLPAVWFKQEWLSVPRTAEGMVRLGDLTREGVGWVSRPMVTVQRATSLSLQDEADLFDLINFGGIPQGETDDDLPNA